MVILVKVVALNICSLPWFAEEIAAASLGFHLANEFFASRNLFKGNEIAVDVCFPLLFEVVNEVVDLVMSALFGLEESVSAFEKPLPDYFWPALLEHFPDAAEVVEADAAHYFVDFVVVLEFYFFGVVGYFDDAENGIFDSESLYQSGFDL